MVEDMRRTLFLYYSSIKLYREVSPIKRPGVEASRRLGVEMRSKLHEPHYWTSPDALNLFDLQQDRPSDDFDDIRTFLQRNVPVGFLDKAGKERRKVDVCQAQGLGGGGTAAIVKAWQKQPPHISPFVDNLSRFVIAISGCIFLLTPMIALTFITSVTYTLVTIVLFVLVFAICLSITSKASNQELLAATAAYAAVLAVFVGNALGQAPLGQAPPTSHV